MICPTKSTLGCSPFLTQQTVDTGGEQVAVYGVEPQVVLVVWVLLPHLMQNDDKLHRVLQSDGQTVIFRNLQVHAVGQGRSSYIYMLCIARILFNCLPA